MPRGRIVIAAVIAVNVIAGLLYLVDQPLYEAARTVPIGGYIEDASYLIRDPVRYAVIAGTAIMGEWRAAIAIEVAYRLSRAVTGYLKDETGRANPRTGDAPTMFKGRKGGRDYDSFPSRTTASAFAIASVLATAFSRRGRWYLVAAAVVGLSRIYTGDHWPSDIFGGAVIGAAIGWTVYRLMSLVRPSRLSS